MEAKFKQRITGAVVLVALAVIFLPMMFERAPGEAQEIELKIPTPPVIDIESALPELASIEAEIEAAKPNTEVKVDATPEANMAKLNNDAPDQAKAAIQPQATTKAAPAKATTKTVAKPAAAKTMAAAKPATKAAVAPKAVAKTAPKVSAHAAAKPKAVAKADSKKAEPAKAKQPANIAAVKATTNHSEPAALKAAKQKSDNKASQRKSAAVQVVAAEPVKLRPQKVASASADTQVQVQTVTKAVTSAGWSVQVGAFANADNAKVFKERLQAQGFKAYNIMRVNKERKLNLVYVGPMADRPQAEQMKQQLANDLKVEGVVVHYRPGS